MNKVDVVVIGAGVVGLAIAREFALAGKEVVILESASKHGTGTSARNSGVIHAGIYYPEGSKKAQWCVRGRHLLYEYLDARHIGHRRTEKLIVAGKEERGKLEALYAKGLANGVDNLRLLTAAQAKALEPALQCHAAIHSPSTGIVDVHELMDSLLGDAQAKGAALAQASRFESAEQINGLWHSEVLGETLVSEILVNSAGLDAVAVAHRIAGLGASHIPAIQFAKGNYARVTGKCPFSRLIYPVPVSGGLGTHLTLDLGGQANLGPDVEWLGPATPEQIAQGLHSSFSYQVDSARLALFEHDVRSWWPTLPANSLSVGYAGIRPKLSGPHEPAADFLVQGPKDHGLSGLINLFGIESPGLTACLAIAQAVVRLP
jgi:L-2-hydroxyglutarate oxidase LhgO